MMGIIVCGMPAVGKTTIARAVSGKFNFPYYSGGDALKELAREQGYNVSGDDWWDTQEGMKFLSKRRDDQSFDRRVDEKLLKILEGGEVVITSYPLAWLAKDALKIWLKASEEKRASRLAGRDQIGLDEARKVIKNRDYQNKVLYQKLYGIAFGEDLTVFDFVIGTDLLTGEKVREILLAIVKQFK